MEGYFKIHREIFDHWVFTDDKAFKIFIWLLGKASHNNRCFPLKIGKGMITVSIKKGQLLFGRHKAEEALFYDGSLIYRKMQKMQKDGMIDIESNNQYSVVTICNYADYQNQETESEQVPNNCRTTDEQLPNNCRTTAEHIQALKELETLKELEEERKKENEQLKLQIDEFKKLPKQEAKPKFNFRKSLLDLGIEKQITEDWIKVRKTKKATNTETAFKAIKKQIEESGLSLNITPTECIKYAVEKSWSGFKFKWYLNDIGGKELNSPAKEKVPAEKTYERSTGF